MKAKFTLALLHISLVVLAQDSSFQIKDYKYRTPGYKALAVSLNLSGQYGEIEQPNGYAANSKHFSIGPAAISYTKIISTDARLHQSTISISPSFYHYSSSNDQNKSIHNNFMPSVSWNRSDRIYRNNQWFFEAGNKLNAGYESNQSKDTSLNYKTTGYDLHEQLTVGVGKGRIEQVQDAQMALYLLKDLAAEGLLSRPFGAEDAAQLAKVVTDINNQRVFDLRRRRKYELTRLDSFFRSSGLTTKTDIRHFAVINDNWSFAFNPARLSGANWYIRLQPELGYNHTTKSFRYPGSLYTQKDDRTTLKLSPVIGYETYRPLNLQWQRNMGISLAYVHTRYKQQTEGVYQGNASKSSSDTAGGQASAHAFYGMGYYPNNRTQISATVDLTGNFTNSRSVNLVSVFNLDLQYFIGYRTFLSATASAFHNIAPVTINGGRKNAHIFNSAFSLSLSHVLF